MESYWSYGMVPWLPLLSALVVLFIIVGIAIAVMGQFDPDAILAAVLAWLVAIGVAIGCFVGYYPYKSEFHRWYHVQGTVTAVDSRLIPSDKSVAQRFVLVINGQPYGVDDTRASIVKVGDEASLSCKREFQFNSESGWACRWGWNPR